MLVEECVCQKCRRKLKAIQFYTLKDGSKTELCKACMTMHVDNFNPETFTWILQKLDIPYIPAEWNVIRDKAYEKDPVRMNGMSVLGKYISKMKLNQWRQYGWADSEALSIKRDAEMAQETEEEKRRLEAIQDQYDKGLISEAEYRTVMTVSPVSVAAAREAAIQQLDAQNQYNENNFVPQELLDEATADLTDEDRLYLALKWGRLYDESELVSLEKKYKEMADCFPVEDSDTISTLKLICKTDLKMNQAIDQGDVEGFQKLAKVSESLRKTSNFTAAQNKGSKNVIIDSLGEFIAMCEREGGFIPRFCTDIPQDKVDITLQDMNNYVKKLVTEDLGFGAQIENALRKIEIQKEMNQRSIEDTFEENRTPLKDEDYKEFYDVAAEWQEEEGDI